MGSFNFSGKSEISQFVKCRVSQVINKLFILAGQIIHGTLSGIGQTVSRKWSHTGNV